MPFGLKNASNTFVRAVECILRPIKHFSDSYVDDLSAFLQAHLAHLREFLRTIRVNGLTLNLKKCSF